MSTPEVSSDRPVTQYPDISDILARKAEERRLRARMSFADKILWVEKARRELAPFDQLRRERRDRAAGPGRPDDLGGQSR
jgi:hypothetical protein